MTGGGIPAIRKSKGAVGAQAVMRFVAGYRLPGWNGWLWQSMIIPLFRPLLGRVSRLALLGCRLMSLTRVPVWERIETIVIE